MSGALRPVFARRLSMNDMPLTTWRHTVDGSTKCRLTWATGASRSRFWPSIQPRSLRCFRERRILRRRDWRWAGKQHRDPSRASAAPRRPSGAARSEAKDSSAVRRVTISSTSPAAPAEFGPAPRGAIRRLQRHAPWDRRPSLGDVSRRGPSASAAVRRGGGSAQVDRLTYCRESRRPTGRCQRRGVLFIGTVVRPHVGVDDWFNHRDGAPTSSLVSRNYRSSGRAAGFMKLS